MIHLSPGGWDEELSAVTPMCRPRRAQSSVGTRRTPSGGAWPGCATSRLGDLADHPVDEARGEDLLDFVVGGDLARRDQLLAVLILERTDERRSRGGRDLRLGVGNQLLRVRGDE